jgi:hypothetical protein
MALVVIQRLTRRQNSKFTGHLKVSPVFNFYVGFIICSTAMFTFFSCEPGLLQQLLSLKWTEPSLAVIHGHYLDSLGLFLRHYPDAVASVVNKLFELLTSLPITIQVLKSFSLLQ